MSEPHHALQQDGGQSVQGIAYAYPDPPPTFRDVAGHHQHSTEGCPDPQDSVPGSQDLPGLYQTSYLVYLEVYDAVIVLRLAVLTSYIHVQ